jgi:hypothetical protein
MNWDSDGLRAAALRLLLCGSVRCTGIAAPLLAELEELGLVTPGRRSGEFRLRHGVEPRLRQFLVVRWPGLAEDENAFRSAPETISAAALRMRRRMPLGFPSGKEMLNRRTWSAWAGSHSKSGFATPPANTVLTADAGLRVRANAGLRIMGEEGTCLSVDEWQGTFGEITVPERAFGRHWQVSGTLPTLIMTVENLGAFIDFPGLPCLLLIHAPGQDTTLATRFIDRLPSEVRWLHFGDIDPAGLRIGSSVSASGSGRVPTVWIPRVAAELLETHARKLDQPWPVEKLWPALMACPVIRWLVGHQRWLEHEAMVLLPGFAEELAQLVQRLPTGRGACLVAGGSD